MVTLTADGTLHELLANVKERAEVRDLSGRVLGHFTPAGDETLFEKAARLFDLEEAKRAAATEKHGATFKEISQRLQSLGNQG